MSDLSEALPIAETFFSIQGEGPTMGVPSVFLRLSHCNLRCPAWGPPGSPQGCDTTDVWSKVWQRMTPKELCEYWKEKGWLAVLRRRGTHLIVTGGEPMLHQSRLVHLMTYLHEIEHIELYVEVETNTTFFKSPDFDYFVAQWNCSPKLLSAGNPLEKAYIPEVLASFAKDGRAYFKFVVQEPQDVVEVTDNYVLKFGISPHRVWLMPEGATRERVLMNSPWVAELAKTFGYRFSSRLQLVLYDKVTGV